VLFRSRPYFTNVSVLDVGNSALESIDIDIWRNFGMMKWIGLSGNRLSSLPREIVDFNLSDSTVLLSLGGNPWSCSCGEQWMTDWLNSTRRRLINADEILCATPARLSGKSIRRMPMAEFCAVSTDVVVPITASLLAAVALAVVVLVVIYRLRVFLHVRWKFHPLGRDECIGEDMDFDLFLCCSFEDHEQFAMPLLELLQLRHFHVCYHRRDFIAGVPIAENIMEAIQRSKRTLCILTENFVKRYV